jgi:two-component system cell cycle sensor histidine kinase/response regulator CckA
LRILLAEDEDLVRRLASRAFRNAGYDVVEVSDGEAALAALREQGASIRAIVTDVVMPGLYGPEFVRIAEEEGLGTRPVLFVSAYLSHPSRPSRSSTQLPQGSHFLRKPFTSSQLVHAFEEALVAAGCEPPQGKVLSFRGNSNG